MKPILLMLMGGAVTACGASEPRASSGDELPMVEVTVAEAQHVQSERSYIATGTLRGRNTAALSSRVMGYVRSLSASLGDTVEEGQVLAVLDDDAARATLRQARASQQEAGAARTQYEQDINAAQAAMQIAETTRARMERLLAERAVTQQQFDEADATFAAARARHAAAQAGLARADSGITRARAAADTARTSLGYTRVRAPFAGLVLQRSADVGDSVAPGTPLFVIEQEATLRAEVAVPESLARDIAVGDEARLVVDAADIAVTGRVDEISPAVDARSRAFLVKVALPELDDALRRGMFVRVHFATGTERTLRVPREAISSRGSLDRVFVVEDGRARLRLVTLGSGSSGSTEILSGLDQGEQVIVDPPRRMMDRQPIEVIQ